MKFIHIADVHWGMAPDGDKPWCRQRTQAIRHTFERAIEETRNQKADLLLIAGDLFHRQPLVRDLKEVNYLFTTIPDTKVVIIAGNHDRIQKSSAVLSFQWAPNVTYLMDEEFTSVYFEEINTEVWGFSYHTAEIREPKLNQVQAPGKDRIHILLGHGGDAGHVPIDRAALAKMKEGAILINYGPIGQSCELDEDGNVHMTAAYDAEVQERIDDGTFTKSYAWEGLIYNWNWHEANFGVMKPERLLLQYDDLSAWEQCLEWAKNSGEWNYPEGTQMTAEEAEEYARIYADASTMIGEFTTKIICGMVDLEEGYSEMLSQLDSINFSRAIECKQEALNRFYAR